MPINDSQLSQAIAALTWYHSIELRPGVFTPGHNYPNIVLTREILSRCEIQEQTCLDVGAMDGLTSTLLNRRNARRVVACDRYDRTAQLKLVAETLGLGINYVANTTLSNFRSAAPQHFGDPFDILVFSGVLYHMYDPMQGLAIVRSLVRPGGVVVIETAAVLSDQYVGYFNANGMNNPDIHNYWSLSIKLLDYLLRYFRLKPLDCAYFKEPLRDTQVIRVAVPCIATEHQLPDSDDKWMITPSGRDDDAEYPRWTSSTTLNRPLAYEGISASNPVYRGSGAVDLYRTVLQSAPIPIDDTLCKLSLGVSI